MLPPHLQNRANERRQVIVRRDLPVSPERAFVMFTRGPEMARWFCHAADSEERLGGEIHAVWADEEGGDDWARTGTWEVFEAPNLAVVAWHAPDGEGEADYLRVAVAPRGEACTVTVISPLLGENSQLRSDVMMEAVQYGWQVAFNELEAVLASQEG